MLPRKGEHQFQEYARIAPPQGASGVEHIGIEVLKAPNALRYIKGNATTTAAINRSGPAEDKGESDIDKEAAEGGVPTA